MATIAESAQGFTRKQRWLLAVVPVLAAGLLRLLCATLRFRSINEPGAWPADISRDGELYVFWHRALLLAAYRYRHLGIHILISASFDGELIARTVALLGFVPVRGSSSRGGAAGLLAMSRALTAGHKCAITADGPRGPVYVAKDGAAVIARNTAVRGRAVRPVSAFYLHAGRAWELRSWDRFVIPKPFSRVNVVWTAPILASSSELGHELQAALDRSVRLAEASS